MRFKNGFVAVSALLIFQSCTQSGGSSPAATEPAKDYYSMALALAPSVVFDIPTDLEYDCHFDGGIVLNNTSVTAYSTSSVNFGETCVSEERLCSDGLLTGGFSYSSCQVNAPASCLFNGETVAHGESVTAYTNSSVGSEEFCVAENRVCENGQLSGSSQYATCQSSGGSASCLFNGQEVAHGSSVAAFVSSTAAFGEQCQMEYRTCEDGVLSGSNQFASCEVNAAESCLFDGRTISHGESVNAYLNSSVASGGTCEVEARVCNNGVLSGSHQYASCNVDAPAGCLFNGETVAHGEVVSAYLSSSVDYGQMCSVESRACDNGHLSGTYQYASCDAGQAAGCLFNGQTIPSGSEVVAYESSSGATCSSEVRICDNGVLSGGHPYASCEVNAEASCLFNGKTILSGQSVTAYASNSPKNKNSCEAETRTCTDGVLSGSFAYDTCEYQSHNPHEDDEDGIKICKHVVEIKHKEHYSRHPNNGLHLGWYKFKERFNCGKHLGWYKHKNKDNVPSCTDHKKWYIHNSHGNGAANGNGHD